MSLFDLFNSQGNMLVAGVNIIEHMPRFCNWNSIMIAFGDVKIDGLHKGFDSAVFKI